MESEEGWTICTYVCPVLRVVENWIVMPTLLSSVICQWHSFLSETPQRKNTSSESALFSLARRQGSSPFRALTQRVNNDMEGKQQRLKIYMSASNLSCLLTLESSFSPPWNRKTNIFHSKEPPIDIYNQWDLSNIHPGRFFVKSSYKINYPFWSPILKENTNHLEIRLLDI